MLDCIVSLTTWKKRINSKYTMLSLYSLIRQKTKYNYKVVLTLSKEEFPNRFDDIPKEIKLLFETKCINIIWADDNYKSFKKIYPVYKLYDCPIMTTDDDLICQNSIVETFMNEHIKNPDYVLSESGVTVLNIPLTGYFRLFPKNSFLDINPKYFKDCFQTIEDDLYLALLIQLKKTKIKYLHTGLIKDTPIQHSSFSLRNYYNKINRSLCIKNLLEQLKTDNII